MSSIITYTTQSGRLTFRFLFRQQGAVWEAFVMDGPPFPPNRLRLGQCPPGCERVAGTQKLRWLKMARITTLEQAQAIAGWWAEDIEKYLRTGKWRIPYKTNDGEDNFTFSIEQTGSEIRIYIEEHPSYGRRDTDAHSTHRYSDGRRRYICWDGALENYAQAEDIAAAWAERTQKYIRTGAGF